MPWWGEGMPDLCIECGTALMLNSSLTGNCPHCDAEYVKGALVKGGTLKLDPRQASHRPSRQPKFEPHTDLNRLPFYSHQQGATREEAIANLWDEYRKHPGKRRSDPTKVYEVVRAVSQGKDSKWWIITIRRKK
jgi:hypothetical protein